MSRKVSRLSLFLLTASISILFALFTACTNDETPSNDSAKTADGVKEVKVIAREWSIEPGALTLEAGRATSLVLENRGALEHDLTIPALNVKLTVPAGQSGSTTVTADKTGEYEMLCSIPSHKEAGMRGTLTVATNTSDSASSAATRETTGSTHTSHGAVVSTAKAGNQELGYRLDNGTKVFEVKAQHVRWEVLPGEYVDAYAYNGQVPGPVIRVKEGDKIRVDFTNELPEDTVIHFHGPTIPNAMDGVPGVTQEVVKPSQRFTYEFAAKPSGTFIYHTHHNSAFQEPKGLYGLFIVEPAAPPKVSYDAEVLQVLGEFGGFYVINGKAFPATQAIEAKIGQKILIRMANLGAMAHPMHMHGHPFKIVATDGYPVPSSAVLTKDVLNIAPGERYDLLLELDNPGAWVFHCHILSHVQNKGVEPGGMITVIKVSE